MTAPDYRGMLSPEAVARLVADARAEVVRERDNAQRLATHYQREAKRLRREIDAATESPGDPIDKLLAVRAALASYMPSDATEGPVEAMGASEPTTGTTGPECGTQAPSGSMRCQLRRGHDGPHEDWRGV